MEAARTAALLGETEPREGGWMNMLLYGLLLVKRQPEERAVYAASYVWGSAVREMSRERGGGKEREHES